MKYLRISLVASAAFFMSACGLFQPNTGSCWSASYGDAEFDHCDYTNKQGSTFEAEIEGLGKVKVKRDEVDASTPAEVAFKQMQAQQSALINSLLGAVLGVKAESSEGN